MFHYPHAKNETESNLADCMYYNIISGFRYGFCKRQFAEEFETLGEERFKEIYSYVFNWCCEH